MCFSFNHWKTEFRKRKGIKKKKKLYPPLHFNFYFNWDGLTNSIILALFTFQGITAKIEKSGHLFQSTKHREKEKYYSK